MMVSVSMTDLTFGAQCCRADRMQFFPKIFDVVSNGFLIGFEFICKVNNNKAQNRLYQPLELPKNVFNTSYFSRKEI